MKNLINELKERKAFLENTDCISEALEVEHIINICEKHSKNKIHSQVEKLIPYIQEMNNSEQIHKKLVNDLISLTNEKEMIWRLHPHNPNGTNIVDYYNMLEMDIIQVESEIKERWDDITSH